MTSAVKKWGNSAAVRIPSEVLAAARLTLDQPVDVREEDGRIIIEPVRNVRFELNDLLKGIRRSNLHQPVQDDSPRGREVW